MAAELEGLSSALPITACTCLVRVGQKNDSEENNLIIMILFFSRKKEEDWLIGLQTVERLRQAILPGYIAIRKSLFFNLERRFIRPTTRVRNLKPGGPSAGAHWQFGFYLLLVCFNEPPRKRAGRLGDQGGHVV